MKTVILAGGFGTRLSEETGVRPKPLVEIGGKPILWHIMKMYSYHGFNEFIICLGYKGQMIKKYFSEYFLEQADVTFDIKNNGITIHRNELEPWKVTLVETGANSMTGGRIKRIKQYIEGDCFFLTYGDGVSDVDFVNLLNFHKKSNSKVTLTAVQPPGRYGAFSLKQDENKITSFREKPKGDGQDTAWINGGFFVVETSAIDLIDNDLIVWEREPLEFLAANGQLSAFKHEGFWECMDTLRDKNLLEDMWESGNPQWKKW